MGRKPSGDKGGPKRGAWCVEEDKVLADYIKKHGEGNWRHVAIMTGLRRSGKSCRLRWLNYLRPDVKRGTFCPQEEDLIIRLHKLLGNRWSLIAGRLPGRTDNEVKNFWNSNLSKRVPEEGRRRGMNIIKANDGDDQNQSSPVKPNDSEDHQVGVVQDTRNLNCTVAAVLPADSDEKLSCFLRDLDNYIHGILQGAEINGCENYVLDDDAYAGDQTARFDSEPFSEDVICVGHGDVMEPASLRISTDGRY